MSIGRRVLALVACIRGGRCAHDERRPIRYSVLQDDWRSLSQDSAFRNRPARVEINGRLFVADNVLLQHKPVVDQLPRVFGFRERLYNIGEEDAEEVAGIREIDIVFICSRPSAVAGDEMPCDRKCN